MGHLFSTGLGTSAPWPGLACTLAESGISLSMGIRGALGRGRLRTTGLKPPSESKMFMISVADDAVYPWWGLDALSNERRLAGRL